MEALQGLVLMGRSVGSNGNGAEVRPGTTYSKMLWKCSHSENNKTSHNSILSGESID
jgi:hypothetical protein